MAKPTLSDALHELASAKTAKSETAKLRDVFMEVEAALQRGVSRKEILAALHADGFTMSMKMFDKALYRIRKGNRTLNARTIHQAPSETIAHKAEKEAKPSVNFRQTLKDIRAEVENADWSKLINDSRKNVPKQ